MLKYIKLSPSKYQLVVNNNPVFISLNSTIDFINIIKRLKAGTITEQELNDLLEEQKNYKGTVYRLYLDSTDKYNVLIIDNPNEDIDASWHLLGLFKSKEDCVSAYPEYFI